jgi:hypothetical protein
MKTYFVKSTEGRSEFFEIINDAGDEYFIRLTSHSDGGTKITETTITKNLLNICLKTGYIFPARSR